MGCDIHMRTEIRKKNKWVALGKIFKSPYYDPKKKTEKDKSGYIWNDPKTDEIWEGRNYNLFAMLANVRNGRGFAGCKTGEGFNPISMPKGIPEDASAEYKKMAKEWDGDGHSHSYLTLKELLEYDWEQVSTLYGVVSPMEYAYFKKHGHPNSWCGAVGGGSVKMITNEQMDLIVKSGMARAIEKAFKLNHSIAWGLAGQFYTEVSWNRTYKQCAGYFYTKTIPQMKKLGKPEDVRLVFFFDN